MQRKEGFLIAHPRQTENILSILSLPTKQMQLEASLLNNFTDVENAMRQKYRFRLSRLPGPALRYQNNLDSQTPSLEFRFISKYMFDEVNGVSRKDELQTGCTCETRTQSRAGCSNNNAEECDCFEFAAVAINQLSEKQKKLYHLRKVQGDTSTAGLPKEIPYYMNGAKEGCLTEFYLQNRHVVYECNKSCFCGSSCPNKVVQNGRKVPLEIFKTENRGFGLRCLVNLKRGQFIDTYLGEVITSTEADAREAQGDPNTASYLFSLDKFSGDTDDGVNFITDESCFVVDGQNMGGPTRFMNHCCQPNVQIHSVSHNKYDYFVYDLAFFACEDIRAGQELTFDYMDADDRQGDDETMDGVVKNSKAAQPCRCEAEMCRKWLWM